MPWTKVKAIEQNTWLRNSGGPSAGGVCYEMCNFIESDKGPWNNPGSYANAVELGRNFASGSAMMAYAKARQLRKAPYDSTPYAPVAGALIANRVYRALLWVGPRGAAPGAGNHEIAIITGGNDGEMLCFEPNFGFFVPTQAGMNNRQALEHHINDQYGQLAQPMQAGNFTYFNVRANNTATPKGFAA